jgi:hypothetical protein
MTKILRGSVPVERTWQTRFSIVRDLPVPGPAIKRTRFADSSAANRCCCSALRRCSSVMGTVIRYTPGAILQSSEAIRVLAFTGRVLNFRRYARNPPIFQQARKNDGEDYSI